MSALRCFLIEDNPTIRDELIATLEEMLPLKVLGWADEQQAALDWLTAQGQDCELLLIDLFLRRGSGTALLAHPQLEQLPAKRVVLSNYANADIRRRCLALGADQVFDKSSEIDELVAYCRSLIAQPAAT